MHTILIRFTQFITLISIISGLITTLIVLGRKENEYDQMIEDKEQMAWCNAHFKQKG